MDWSLNKSSAIVKILMREYIFKPSHGPSRLPAGQPHPRPLPKALGEGRKTPKTIGVLEEKSLPSGNVYKPQLDPSPRSFGEGPGVGLTRKDCPTGEDWGWA